MFKPIIFLTAIFFISSCQIVSSKNDAITAEKVANEPIAEIDTRKISSVREIDFQNFAFPWTKTFGGEEKFFTLKNGFTTLSDGRKLSVKGLSFINIVDGLDEEALINIKIDDGNATQTMLYVFAVENNKPKLLESFEFGENNTFFGTAFDAHGELIIETYRQESGDSECCPSIIEISYYKWQKNKFVLQGNPKKISNDYVKRTKNK